MTKRTAETFAEHESVPPGALPFFAPSAKRSRSRGGSGLLSSPSDSLSYKVQGFYSSSDEMSDVSDIGAADQADAVSAHHLATIPDCWAASQASGMLQHHQQLSSLGILSPPACPESRLFLEQLAGCLYHCQLAGSSSGSVNPCIASSIGTATWHSFAELNVVMARHFPSLPTGLLRGYHSFTRAPRAQLWARFAASQCGQLAETAPMGLPAHLLLTRFLLEHVLASYPTASCVLYAIELPQWLRGWCARWGHSPQQHHHHHQHAPAAGPNGALRVLALFAYEDGPVAAAAGREAAPPPRVLYIPCLG